MSHHKKCDCYDCQRARDRRHSLYASALIAGVIVAAILWLAGCNSTVTPAPIPAQQASYDQGDQNSGIIALVDDGAIITARARERYNALLLVYGGDFLPALGRDYGVKVGAEGTFLITREALQKFILMNAWRRMGRAPGQPNRSTP